jgi:hypothetical protein
MTAARRQPRGWLPLVWAFMVWFLHFLLCWAAVELWPGQWQANAVAWAATVGALLALGWHWRRLQRSTAPAGSMLDWVHHLGRGATAIAGLAVLFSALPSLVFLP